MRQASCWTPVIEYAALAFTGRAPVTVAFEEGEASGVAAARAAQTASALQTLLEEAQARASNEGHGPAAVRDALFAVVAWLDERALSSDWPGRTAWRAAPLQRHYFGTTRAGTEFFERLDALPDDAAEVREIYALMLLWGFRGRFAARPVAEFFGYRQALFERLGRELQTAPLNAHAPLFPLPPAPAALASGRSRRRVTWALVLLIGLPLLLLLGLGLIYDWLLMDLARPLLGGL
ncbi:DotU family type IV/VI secretion system protein [Paraburkholderia bonniea]|uniref:DotU family type IV/VI secretion system protein n=1 Tax=Paraburkholderia bonniea TaxID=2152891 RepID=UPI001290AC67|nr:DotU family type IV/VI secretion system protein [Paraburkholderia bonniea]WJF89265.1 DotU family type IV/VI secretion system protein [Paraburkholderia bonniea]WJF92581.1 DotU family type IV/VI secretion system protein [Paraburkholderia bonniea]